MYIDYSSWETFEYSLNSLNLDINNPRIKYRGATLNQTQIMKFLIDNEKVYELAKKISEEGYFINEEPIICIENNKKVVLEGNRRTSALKLLQDPNKYLSNTRAKILLDNISRNKFNVNKKVKCYIAPNRLHANPIIYERHNGATLQKWKTGNQYAFVAEMYYDDGLEIKDICDVLNESVAKILKPLKAYNLFLEGQEILSEEGIEIDISNFEITNLERFYNYEEARKLIGIEFDDKNGDLIINLPEDEFKKRLLVVFKILLDSERFSRDFNKDDDKKNFIEKLKQDYAFDLNATSNKQKIESKSKAKKANLEDEKKKTTTRKKKQTTKKSNDNYIIARDKEIIFNNEKLDTLFTELKHLPIDKLNSFALLLRSYLEQSLYFYIKEKDLLGDLSLNANEKNKEHSLNKVTTLIKHIKGKYKVQEDIDTAPIMEILKFNTNKEYSNASLKIMLDYIKNNELKNHLDANQLKNLNFYIDNIKNGLDLAVHNIETIVDLSHNKRAWKHLEILFEILSSNLNTED